METRKRSFSQISFQDEELDNEVTEMPHTFYNNILCLFGSSNKATGFHYDLDVGVLELIETFPLTNDICLILESLKLRYQPTLFVCNSKIGIIIRKDKDGDPKEEYTSLTTEILSSKEFQEVRGKTFLDSLIEEMNESNHYAKQVSLIKDVISSEDNNQIFCALSAFSLYFERILSQSGFRRAIDIIKKVELCLSNDSMIVDSNSIFSLNIYPLSDKRDEGEKKTLYKLLSQVCSKVGGNTLKRFLLRPSTNLSLIEDRLNTVANIISEIQENRNYGIVAEIRDCLRASSDISQISFQLSMGNHKGLIWKKLRSFAINSSKIAELIDNSTYLKQSTIFQKYVEAVKLQSLTEVRTILENVLDFNNEQSEVSIQYGIDDEFDNYRNTYTNLETILLSVSRKMSKEVGIDVSAVYIPQFGYLCTIDVELSEHAGMASWEEVFRTSTTSYLKNSVTDEMGNTYGDIYSLIRDLEIEILQLLKEKVMPFVLEMERFKYLLGEIDVMICFAKCSYELDFKRPEMVHSSKVELKGSFDPLSSRMDQITNDIILKDNNKVMVLSGPNYSGKTTILLKVGLIIYMAHIGCFIPCQSGSVVAVTDRILTRINSRDSVAKLQSTFLLDTLQMSKCLNRSTPKSLVLVDEFGKGTDVVDGPSLLAACVRFFSQKGQESPRVLVATHMTEVFKNNLVDYPTPLQLCHMEVSMDEVDTNKTNDKESLTYLYRMKDGLCDESYGIYCASKSGISSDVISRAKKIKSLIDQYGGCSSNVTELLSCDDPLQFDDLFLHKIERVITSFLSWDLEDPSLDFKEIREKLRLLVN